MRSEFIKKNKENMKMQKTIKGMSGDGENLSPERKLEYLHKCVESDEVGIVEAEKIIERMIADIKSMRGKVCKNKVRIALLRPTIVEGGELTPREPTAREISFRIDELENRVEGLEAFGSPAVSAEADAEPSFRWITDREPTKADADRSAKVAVYKRSGSSCWGLVDYMRVAANGAPWAQSDQIQQFTANNPAPSPYDQEVSG